MRKYKFLSLDRKSDGLDKRNFKKLLHFSEYLIGNFLFQSTLIKKFLFTKISEEVYGIFSLSI